MKLRASFLAQSAKTNVDGTFDVGGGGITEFQVRGGFILGVPLRLDFAVIIRVELDDDEVETLRSGELRVYFQGKALGLGMQMPIALRRQRGEKRYYVNLITHVVADVPNLGSGYVEVTLDGGAVRAPHMHFEVKGSD